MYSRNSARGIYFRKYAAWGISNATLLGRGDDKTPKVEFYLEG